MEHVKFHLILSAFVVFCSSLGTTEKIDVNNPDIVAGSKLALEMVAESYDSKFHINIREIVKADKFVGSGGAQYRIDTEIRQTKCQKSEVLLEEVDCCEFEYDNKPLLQYCRSWVGRSSAGKLTHIRTLCQNRPIKV